MSKTVQGSRSTTIPASIASASSFWKDRYDLFKKFTDLLKPTFLGFMDAKLAEVPNDGR